MERPAEGQPVPFLDTEQMIEVDRAMMEDFHIQLIQMMENAGRSLAHLARSRFFEGDPRGKTATVLAGTGGNGGGALVAARRLQNYGTRVHVFVTRPDEAFAPVPRHQLEIVRRMSIPVSGADLLAGEPAPDLILDGLIGYSLRGAPHGDAAEMIRWANSQGSPILALDAPSGVDTSTGRVFDPAVLATATMTLALPKAGLVGAQVSKQVGELYLADISVPPELYASPALGLEVGNIFATDDIIRLR